MLNPRGISYFPFLSSVWGGEFLLFSMVFLPGSLTLSALASGERYLSRIGGKAGLGKGSREPKRLDFWRSESAAERQGGPSPHMLREMVQECSSSPRPGLCQLHPGSCGCSSLSFSSRDGRFLELCLVASARGLQRQSKLRYWPMGAQGQTTEPTRSGFLARSIPWHTG